MKLVFRKNDQEEITIFQLSDGKEQIFVYTNMIKALIKDGKLEEPIVEGAFTEEEMRSIKKMVADINKETEEAMKGSAAGEGPSDNLPL
jgi:hypothetical protein